MTDAEIVAIAGLVPHRINLLDDRALLDYVTMRICPVLDIRSSDVEPVVDQIVQTVLALRLSRAAA
jgi:hypothetical protein